MGALGGGQKKKPPKDKYPQNPDMHECIPWKKRKAPNPLPGKQCPPQSPHPAVAMEGVREIRNDRLVSFPSSHPRAGKLGPHRP